MLQRLPNANAKAFHHRGNAVSFPFPFVFYAFWEMKEGDLVYPVAAHNESWPQFSEFLYERKVLATLLLGTTVLCKPNVYTYIRLQFRLRIMYNLCMYIL